MTEIDKNSIPKHIAVIMDGNGRWAMQRNLPRTKGHIEGVKRVEELVSACREWGVKALTLFTFSTENWSRPKEEVFFLMNMIDAIVKRKIESLNKSNIRFQILGRKEKIPEPVLTTIKKGIEKTKNNTGMTLNLAFNYGSRLEILDAVKEVVRDVQDGKWPLEALDSDKFSSFMYTKGLPDPDLLIRTSGEKRISNFLLWQMSYTELYFTEVLWPDFDRSELEKAVIEFQERERRYGGLNAEKG
ncbi:MAG: isoprenyl transferase [Candidatus Omnitrophica bacterium]|nr:isoprenyl transferase [Candidatus Omnitrophota bacterium]